MGQLDCGANAGADRLRSASMPDEPAAGRLIVLRHPDLRRYLSARFLVAVAEQVQTVAVGWQVFIATGSPFDLGLVALSPDEIRGRVSAVNSVFIGASNELGQFESGLTAAWWGVVPAVVVGGLATLAVATVWSRLFGTLWRLDRLPRPRSRIARV